MYLRGILVLLLVLLGFAVAIPMREPWMEKRMSRQALIRLMLRKEREGEIVSKRGDGQMERRSFDDNFQNCFLSPVQCMLPRSRR